MDKIALFFERLSSRRKYENCMEEIKARTKAVNIFLSVNCHAMDIQIKTESIALQFRKILELIAFASLAANRIEFEKQHKKFKSEWNASRILKKLEKVNPKFYPRPYKEKVLNEENGESILQREYIKSGFLTKDDWVKLYDKCSGIIHIKNPYSGEQSEGTREFLDSAPEWMKKIDLLLSCHKVQLVDETKQLWVKMGPKPDDICQIGEFESVS